MIRICTELYINEFNIAEFTGLFNYEGFFTMFMSFLLYFQVLLFFKITFMPSEVKMECHV